MCIGTFFLALISRKNQHLAKQKPSHSMHATRVYTIFASHRSIERYLAISNSGRFNKNGKYIQRENDILFGKPFCFTIVVLFGFVSVASNPPYGWFWCNNERNVWTIITNRKCPVCLQDLSSFTLSRVCVCVYVCVYSRFAHSFFMLVGCFVHLFVSWSKKKKISGLLFPFRMEKKGGNLTLFLLLCKSLKLDLMLCSVLLRNFLSK